MDFSSGYAGLIGDISGSKAHPRRGELQTLLTTALAETSRRVPAVQELQPTIGDEFQGLFASVAGALQASFWIRLCLMRGPNVRADARFGIGWGGLVVLDAARTPFAQDGPAWWAARQALDTARAEARRAGRPKGLRTWFLSFENMYQRASDVERARWQQLRPIFDSTSIGPPGRLRPGLDELINAYLVCRDQIVSTLDTKDVRSVMDVFSGRSQTKMAEEERVSQSAISQRLKRSGAYALRSAEELMTRTLEWSPSP